tara:strand:- start:247 stop:813 length:567 start_codon:yes stop_codon:yes gene_type:complete
VSKFSSVELQNVLSKSKKIFTNHQIDSALAIVADRLNADLVDADPIFLCVLNGALMVYGQLMQKITIPARMDTIYATRYGDASVGSSLEWKSYPSSDLSGQVVVLVDDVLEGGVTLAAMVDYCQQAGATKVLTVVLINKKIPRVAGGLMDPDYAAFEMGDGFLIGYGLDYKGYLRNTKDVYILDGNAS